MGVQERKEREREQRMHDILQAARTVFVLSGLQGASMEKIAAQAELAKGTLYRYFRNRDELLLTLLIDDLTLLTEKMERVAKSNQKTDNKLMKAVETFYTFSKDNELFYSVITQVNMCDLLGGQAGETDTMVQFSVLHQRMMDSLTQMLEKGVEEGMFHLDKPAKYIVLQMILSVKGTIMVVNNGLIPPEWAKEIDLEIVLHDQAALFIRGLKSPPSVGRRSAARSTKQNANSVRLPR